MDIPNYARYPLADDFVPDDPHELALFLTARVAHAGKLLDQVPLAVLAGAWTQQENFGAASIADVMRTALAFRTACEEVRDLAQALPDGFSPDIGEG